MRLRFARWENDSAVTSNVAFQFSGKRTVDNQIVIVRHVLSDLPVNQNPDTIAQSWMDANVTEAQAMIDASIDVSPSESGKTKTDDFKAWARTHAQSNAIKSISSKADAYDVESAIAGILDDLFPDGELTVPQQLAKNKLSLLLSTNTIANQAQNELLDIFGDAED